MLIVLVKKMNHMENASQLRYGLIDRPGVLGNYVPVNHVNYHWLYHLSAIMEGF